MQRSVALIIGLGLFTGVALAQVQPGSVVGDIITGGSPTAGALVNRIANRFRAEGYQGNLVVDSVGTTAGFGQFCAAQQDIVNADRLITEQEQSACTASGRTATAFRIASDAMVVAVSPQNDFVNTLSTAELTLLFSTALNWSDVRPEWPVTPIQRYIPASGTEDFNFLVNALYGGNSQAFLTAIGAQSNSDYTIALANVQGDANAVGFFPAGFAAQNSASLRTVPINGVAADAANISAGTYPLVRPIYLYSDLGLMAQQPQVGSFINYALTVSGDELVSAGLFPPPPADLAQAKQVAAQGAIPGPAAVASPTTAAPVEPPSAVYCASTYDLLIINGEAAPNAAGCACVRVYGPHQLSSAPDLYSGFDVNGITPLSQSPTQCLAGVTTYNWRPETGFTDGVLTPNVNNLPTPTPDPATLSPEQATLAQSLSILRSDLDLMATAIGGTGRPEGWSGSADVTDPTLPLILRLDLEYLTTAAIGAQRPAGWFGSVPSTPEALARDVRHDLELLADAYLPAGERPVGWVGDLNPLVRCDRPTQTLVSLLQRGGVFTLTSLPIDGDFCLNAMLEATTFSERALLTNPADQPIFSAAVRTGTLGAQSIDTEFAVAFLDKGAVLSVGVIPQNEPVTAVARSLSEFSRMTLVQGDNFLAFVDYRDTTLTEDEFETLPNADEYPTEPFCSADWCGN